MYNKDGRTRLLFSDRYNGLRLEIISHGTHPCAYVGVTKSHPLYGVKYGDVKVTIPGRRLTFSGKREGELWWLGWDYNQHGDLYLGGFSHVGKRWTLGEVLEHCKSVIDQINKAYGEAKPLSVYQAIKTAIEKHTFTASFDDETGMWSQVVKPANITPTICRRNRRVEYALRRLAPGHLVDSWIARGGLEQQGTVEDLVRGALDDFEADAIAHAERYHP